MHRAQQCNLQMTLPPHFRAFFLRFAPQENGRVGFAYNDEAQKQVKSAGNTHNPKHPPPMHKLRHQAADYGTERGT